jgi:tRNA pseudouridine38-40 synthase
MQQGASYFVGDHDFAAFRTSGCAAERTRRRIDQVEVTAEDDFIKINVFGSGFLRNMIRIMAGTLVEIGKGKMPPGHVRDCLADPRLSPGPTAPAHGLCLVEVFY